MKFSLPKEQSGQLPNITRAIIPMGFLGASLFAVVVATISDGYMNNALHLFAAVTFFVVICIDFLIITVTIKLLRDVNPSFISNFSFYYKCIVCGFYFVVLTAIIIIVITNGGSIPQDDIDTIEWVTTTLLVLYISSFIGDFSNLNVTVENGVVISWKEEPKFYQSVNYTLPLNYQFVNSNYQHLEMMHTAPQSFISYRVQFLKIDFYSGKNQDE